jgi:hypothetical protein
MEPHTKDTGRMISNMDLELKCGEMELSMSEIIWMVKRREKVSSIGLMVVSTKENSLTIIFMEKESMNGLITEYSQETGNITRCMVMVSSHGQTWEYMKENITMIRSKDKVNSRGLMVESILVDGMMASKMAMESIIPQRERLSMENGKMERGSDGYKRVRCLLTTEMSKDRIRLHFLMIFSLYIIF